MRLQSQLQLLQTFPCVLAFLAISHADVSTAECHHDDTAALHC